MLALVVFLFACTTRYVLTASPTGGQMPAMVSPEEADRTNAVLTALGLTSWFACPLAGRLTNKMVTLADGYTYDQDRVIAYGRRWGAVKSPHYRHLTIPNRLAKVFVNLDLMDIAKSAEALAQSIIDGEVPAVVRRWIGSPLRQPIWICADGRSRFLTSFKRPFTIQELGMLLAFDNGDFCFRNIRLEQVVDEVCRLVNCGTGDALHISGSPVRMEEPGARQSLSTSGQLSPSTAASSSRYSVASHYRQIIDASSSGTSTSIRSPTSIASSSRGISPLANHHEPNTLVSSVGTDDAASTADTHIVDAVPWPSASEVKPAPSLPRALSSAWAATIAHTRDLDNKSFWSRPHPYSTAYDSFYAALFWAVHYRTTFKPPNMELPPKPTNPGDMRGWQASCHSFFQAAEDIVVNAISEKHGNPPKFRHARALQVGVLLLGLIPRFVPAPVPGLVPVPAPGLVPGPVPGLVPAPAPGLVPAPAPSFVPRRKRMRISRSDDIADTIPRPSMSTIELASLFPCGTSSAWAARSAYMYSLDDHVRWDWENLTLADLDVIHNALFWVRQYTTVWKPPGMSLPPKPANSDGFSEWQTSCYRFFQDAEDLVVKAISENEGVGVGSAGINREAKPLQRHLIKMLRHARKTS